MSKKRKKSSEQLVERLRKEGWNIPEDYRFQSLNPGHWAKSAGAFSWIITGINCDIGSPDTVADCLKAKTLTSGPHGAIYAD